jgi:CBS-domain-containing membrane protein
VLPLMAAVGISVWLFDLLLDPKANPIETVAAEVQPDEQVDQLRSIRQRLSVGAVMDQRCLRFAEPLLVTTAGNTLTTDGRRSAVILDGNERLVGIVTLRDINRVVSRWQKAAILSQTVGEISTKDVLVAYADESLARRDLRQLPVVQRSDEKQVVGLLTREAIDLACRLALTRELLKPFWAMVEPQKSP